MVNMSGSLYFGLTEHMWLIASFTSSMFAKPVDKIIGLLRLLNFVKSGYAVRSPEPTLRYGK